MTTVNLCCCPELDDLVVVGMGDPEGLDDRIFTTVARIEDHGEPQWWLYASTCTVCAQSWMVAQDERIHDNFCLKRLDAGAMREIVEHSKWPDDFLHFEQVLRLERQSGKIAQFLDPQSPALIDTIAELRRERPDISLDEIAYVLAISINTAGQLARRSDLKPKSTPVSFLMGLFPKRTGSLQPTSRRSTELSEFPKQTVGKRLTCGRSRDGYPQVHEHRGH